MAITAAAVEASGWVLRLTLTGALSSAIVSGFSVATANDNLTQWTTNFGAYALAPNSASPALKLATTTSGYVQSGGQAVASSAVARTLIGTKALRKPVISGPAANTRLPKQPDEVDNGDGTITVRIALSQHVYQGDAGLTLAALAGWRSGQPAQSAISVTNNSAVPAPAPIVRWADVPYKLQSGSFALEVLVASHHPNGVAPVAGVRFTVTDGTTIKSYWATALSASAFGAGTANGTGVPPRVYAATVDPTAATALTQGLLRCDFEVYPWIGPVQKSDTAGTRSMTGLGTAALATAAQVPFVVAWNPGNAWIIPRFVDVDEAGGTATPSSVTVATTAAGAAAGTPANSINTALLAMYAANVTVAAANGQGAITRSGDGLTITLRKANAGTGCTGIVNGAGSAAVTSGFTTGSCGVTVRGDPGDATGRACIWRAPGSVNGSTRVTRLRVASLSVEAQTNAVMSSLMTWLDNVEVRGVSGQETTTGYPFGATNALLWATNVKYWKHATTLRYSGVSTTIMARSCAVERDLYAPVVANCARLPSASALSTPGFTAPVSYTDPGLALERIAVGNDLRYLNGSNMNLNMAILTASIPANLTLGTTYSAIARFAALNNVGEVYGATAGMWGVSNLVAFSEVVVEGNTFTGDRTNNPYGILADATIALTDAATPQSRLFRFANNIAMKNANKQDSYNDAAILSQRQGVALSATRNKAYAVGAQIGGSTMGNVYQCTTAGTTATTGGPTGTGAAIGDGTAVWSWVAAETRQHGYNVNGTGMWSSSYGVGYEGNIDFQGPAGPAFDPEFFFEFYGIGSQSLAADGIDIGSDPFTLDKSGTPQRLAFQPTPDGTGGGNYKPLPGGAATYALGRAKTANSDVDSRGAARTVPFAAGGIEGATATILVAAGTQQPSRASVSGVGLVIALAAARGVLASRAAASGATWLVALATAGGRMPMQATTSVAGWITTIATGGGRSATHASTGVAGWTTTLALDGDRSATTAARGTVTWSGGLAPARAPSAMTATASFVTVVSAWLVAIDAGRIAIVDRTLPILLPGSATPRERTLTVTGDYRTVTIA